ncbi:3-dehydroquinate synthase [Paracoccaceae bacterium]|nr:3-dehydroquinate synthase [Paracoccaceae bacterium]
MINKRNINLSTKNLSYDIWIGNSILTDQFKKLKSLLENRKVAIVTERTVFKKQYENFSSQLKGLLVLTEPLVLEPGEATKSWNVLRKILDWFGELNLARNDYVIALGGGVIGDTVGLAASLFRRGLNLIQIPTTFLSQVDSSIGGKTAINTGYAKNVIGTFYQPSIVFCDVSFLSTLDQRNYLSGYAEVLKMALVFNKNFFRFLEENKGLTCSRDINILIEIITKSLELKGRVVEIDETEKGKRSLLNFGHTFGHALESYFGYSEKLLHGEAVAWGIILASSFANNEGHLKISELKKIKDHIDTMKLISEIAELQTSKIDLQRIINFMKQDKKVSGDNINLILLKDIGNGFIERNVSFQKLENFLQLQLS